jgi:uncharacterized protein (DUF427 family)
MQDRMSQGLTLLRYEPTQMRVRVASGDQEIVDTTRAVLVWEPRRVVPSYAVPVEELRAELAASPAAAVPVPDDLLHPGIPFAAHSCPGESVDVLVGAGRLTAAGFRPDDPDLAGYVVLDFAAFDSWFEEDERLVAHPREPYHRVAVRPSSRQVRIELDGVVLAESSRPTLVFETSLPMRYYLPRDDIVAGLEPSELRTACAYKGEAVYYSVGGHPDLAWSYPEPLVEATQLAGLIALWDDHLDVFIDGKPRERRRNAIADTMLDEFGIA